MDICDLGCASKPASNCVKEDENVGNVFRVLQKVHHKRMIFINCAPVISQQLVPQSFQNLIDPYLG